MGEPKRERNWIALLGLIIIVFLALEDVALIYQNKALRAALAPYLAETLKTGQQMDGFKVQTLSGQIEEINYGDLARKYLFFVLSTTCPHCHGNIDNWNKIAQYCDTNRCAIYAISIVDFERTKKYRDTTSMHFQLVALADTGFVRKYRINAVPTTILVRGNGTVERVWTGELSEHQTHEIMSLSASRSTE